MKRMEKINQAILFLFKSVYEQESQIEIPEENKVRLITRGIILDFNKIGDTFDEQKNILQLVESMYGKHIYALNNSFHKNWKTVESIDPKVHYLQQVLHYITTYGYDALGITYDSKNVYIPNEVVEVPECVKPLNLIVIHKIGDDEILTRIVDLLISGVALSEQQIKSILFLMSELQLDIRYDIIANKEIKAAIYPALVKKPYISVDEFLRVLTYKVTGNTLLLRSYRNYQIIKSSLSRSKTLQKEVATLLDEYIASFGMENIASQFLRNKMLFLAFKCPTTKSTINRIRRCADKYHKAQSVKHLTIDDINDANIYQLVKYYNYIYSKINPTSDKLYQIRNGLNYLKLQENTKKSEILDTDFYKDLLVHITDKLIQSLSHLNNKLIYIPDYIDYKVPSSLKRICQGIPEGSVLKFPNVDTYTIGIHWTNLVKNNKTTRIDLDLHANSLDGQVGWFSNYKNSEVLYSGDMTNAPVDKGGATEALLFKTKNPYIVTLNDYTQSDGVTYQFIFDFNQSTIKRDKNKLPIFTENARTLNCKIDKEHGSNTLGLAMSDKFYFTNSSIFSGRCTLRSELLERLIKYYTEIQEKSLSLEDLLNAVGAKVIHDKSMIPVGKDLDFDLSLEAITEDTFVQMFINSEN